MNLTDIVRRSRGSQDKFELLQFLRIARRLEPRVIVEIGVFIGGLTETFRTVFPQAKVYGIDMDYSKLEFTDFTAIQGDSHQASTKESLAELLNGEPIDILFIDGDHSLEGVRQDFEFYSPFVKAGGIIAFHDINSNSTHNTMPGQLQVGEFMEELKSRLSYASVDLIGHRKSPGIGIMFV